MSEQRRYLRTIECARHSRPQLWILVVGLALFSFENALGQNETEQTPGKPAQVRASAEQLLADANRLLSEKSFDKAAALASQAAAQAPQSPRLLQGAAELLYLSGKSRESVALFDRVVELAPESAPQNWQRGIALCSIGDFGRGAEQFKTHHDVNPDDVENSAWYFLCVAKTDGLEAARKTVIPSRGDGRQPMMSILQMLKAELEPEEVLRAAEKNSSPGRARQSAQFYADLYVGLYYDSLGEAEQARKYLERSQSYGIEGYMVRTAKVYLDDRFPESESEQKVKSK